jgi:hypothetical protein
MLRRVSARDPGGVEINARHGAAKRRDLVQVLAGAAAAVEHVLVAKVLQPVGPDPLRKQPRVLVEHLLPLPSPFALFRFREHRPIACSETLPARTIQPAQIDTP